jgi:hypothetical protein
MKIRWRQWRWVNITLHNILTNSIIGMPGCWKWYQHTYSLHFKIKVTFGHKPCYGIQVTFGEIYLKFRQTNWNVARNNVNVVADEVPSQIIIYTCLTIDIWTWWRRLTSMWFHALRCHPPKMAGFKWNWRQKFSTLLWTPLAGRKVLSESYAMHTISC